MLRVRLQFGMFDRFVRFIVAKLPSFLQAWVSVLFPKWTLPTTVILKTSKPDAYPESFDNEVSIYKKLKPIQGKVVPVYYGEASFEGKRALVLSDVGGDPLYSPQIPVFTKEDFTEKMSQAIGALHQLGVEHDDNFLPNYHLVNNRIFILDHEMSQPVEEDDKKLHMQDDISQLWGHLQEQQNTQRFDGLRE